MNDTVIYQATWTSTIEAATTHRILYSNSNHVMTRMTKSVFSKDYGKPQLKSRNSRSLNRVAQVKTYGQPVPGQLARDSVVMISATSSPQVG